MKIATAVTVWNDAVGRRISIAYSEIDDETGQIISDNRRVDRVITNQTQKEAINAVEAIAQSIIDSL